MSEYRRFTKSDWCAFEGAEPFTEGSDPFIYEREMIMSDSLVQLCVITDKDGVQIQMFSDKDNEDNCWMKDESLTSMRAEGYLRQLICEIEKYTCAPDLAYELDHPSKEVFKGFKFL